MALAAFANVPDSSDTVSFDISDDESDCDRGYAQTSVCTLLVIQQRTKGSAYPNAVEEPLRRIAGTRRVSNYRERTGLAPAEAVSGTSFQLLQSITAIPALADRSFEEIRLECYSQSAIATGRPPQAANTSLNPSAVIPPLFMPVRDDNAEESGQAVTMLDVWYKTIV